MGRAYKKIMAGLEETLAFAKGEPAKVRVIVPAQVKAIRENLNMTQEEFAEAFRVSVNTLRHWERGNRVPQGPAAALLKVIQHKPKIVMQALAE
ncbi:MAG: helix-turn-helix domain-containing protein [Bacteroidetes bacterium]|nr:helix-turn-helix domain-containing protein [Bacteroidota bacterium]